MCFDLVWCSGLWVMEIALLLSQYRLVGCCWAVRFVKLNDAVLTSAGPGDSSAIECEHESWGLSSRVSFTSIVCVGEDSKIVIVCSGSRELQSKSLRGCNISEYFLSCFPMCLARIFTELGKMIDCINDIGTEGDWSVHEASYSLLVWDIWHSYFFIFIYWFHFVWVWDLSQMECRLYCMSYWILSIIFQCMKVIIDSLVPSISVDIQTNKTFYIRFVNGQWQIDLVS